MKLCEIVDGAESGAVLVVLKGRTPARKAEEQI